MMPPSPWVCQLGPFDCVVGDVTVVVVVAAVDVISVTVEFVAAVVVEAVTVVVVMATGLEVELNLLVDVASFAAVSIDAADAAASEVAVAAEP